MKMGPSSPTRPNLQRLRTSACHTECFHVDQPLWRRKYDKLGNRPFDTFFRVTFRHPISVYGRYVSVFSSYFLNYSQ